MARVLLLFGGRSAEHEVSCVSAGAVFGALKQTSHQVIAVGIDRSGSWFLAETDHGELQAVGKPASLILPSGALMDGEDRVAFDVVFPVLHGQGGEDGAIQGLFEVAGIPYVGCGVLSSAVAMDKDIAKRVAESVGLSTARWIVVRPADFVDPVGCIDRVVDNLGLPVFVKPAESGSSLGVSKARTKGALKEGIKEAFLFGPKVLVEEAIVGREIEVGVIGGPQVSMPGEIVTGGEWYDYDAKYNDAASRFIAPADLSEAEVGRVKELAELAFVALECEGLARVDFLFEGNERGFLFNELNTMPGFTLISGFPKVWAASDLTQAELCDQLVKLALRGVGL